MWLRVFPRVGSPPTVVQAGFRSPLFWLSFGNIGSATSAPPPVVVDTVDYHDGRPREPRVDVQAILRRNRLEDQAELKQIVERALGLAPPESGQAVLSSEPLPAKRATQVARQIMPDMKLDGIEISLRDLGGLLQDYQQSLIEQRQMNDDEEAILVLMMN